MLEVENSCDALGRIYVGVAREVEELELNGSTIVEVVAGETYAVTLVHDADRDPSGDRLVVVIGTDSSNLDAAIEASPTDDPPTITVTGSCTRGDPCTVDGSSVRCPSRAQP